MNFVLYLVQTGFVWIKSGNMWSSFAALSHILTAHPWHDAWWLRIVSAFHGTIQHINTWLSEIPLNHWAFLKYCKCVQLAICTFPVYVGCSDINRENHSFTRPPRSFDVTLIWPVLRWDAFPHTQWEMNEHVSFTNINIPKMYKILWLEATSSAVSVFVLLSYCLCKNASFFPLMVCLVLMKKS